jgi:Fe2+ or Zn2+ uptake regulation protein
MRKKTHDEYLKKLDEVRSNVEPLEEYIDTNTPIRHRCKICDYKWPLRPARALYGNVCPNCSGKIKRTHEEYVVQLSQLQPNIEVAEEYISRHTKILHRCKLDEYEWKTDPGYFFQGGGCPVCSGKTISPAPIYKNSIWWSEHRGLFSKFMTEDQMKTIMPNSGKKITMTCPDCGRQKSISPNTVFRTHSIGCICSDGVSYPNKFVYALLNQLEIEYSPEHTFKWSNKKRYDVYIPLLNCVIENHGEQHYDNAFKQLDSRTLEEEQENDRYKKELALKNGITQYIVLDCRESNVDWLKNNILNSVLSEIFDLSTIDWIRCHEFACSNLVNVVADLWNKGSGVYTIVKEMRLSDTTVVRYLKQAAECGLCDYTKENSYKRMGEANSGANHHMARLTAQLTDEFEVVRLWRYMTEAESALDINMKQISACCYDTHKTAGGYRWRFLHDVTKKDGTLIPGAITLGLITEEEALAQLSQQ